jgi:hypothetical protein
MQKEKREKLSRNLGGGRKRKTLTGKDRWNGGSDLKFSQQMNINIYILYFLGYNTSILEVAGRYVSTVLPSITFQKTLVLGRKHTKQI